MSALRRAVSLLVLLALTACQQMGATEFGVRFRKLPPVLGGGVAEAVIHPGQMAIVMPWDSIYRFDTAVKDVSWGRRSSGNDDTEFVHTRALDGNEVALAVTVRYRVITDPASLANLVQTVATSDRGVRELVMSVGRADIRTYMNQLRTSQFLDETDRYEAVDAVKKSMEERLKPYGIEILRVSLDDFRFERLNRDGTVDSSYQDKLTEIQKLREDTEREKSRIDTVKAKKQQEFNLTQGGVNREIAEADGFKRQAALRGDGYFEAKSNDAKAILAQGKAEVEGLIEQINALNGPGGEAILKLELARSLQKSDPRFVVLSEGEGGQGIAVRRTDTNDLLGQIGAFEALREPEQRQTPRPAAAPAP